MSAARSALAGKRIVVTRAANQADDLDDLLRSRGAEPLSYPCIAIAPPADTGPLDAALRGLVSGEFAWLVLTSRNTVAMLAERLKALGVDLRGNRPLHRQAVSLAAVGAATAEAAGHELGLRADLIPGEFVAEALAAALVERLRPGDRVLLCQADIARPVLADALRAAGAEVTSLVAYCTVIGRGGIDLPARLAAGHVDAITFTSASTVRSLLQRLAAEGGRPADLADVCIAGLGPITADAAQKLGLTVHVVPVEPTIPALVEALEAHFANRPQKPDFCEKPGFPGTLR
jgi:uroporphyrinogen-III synthase